MERKHIYGDKIYKFHFLTYIDTHKVLGTKTKNVLPQNLFILFDKYLNNMKQDRN